MILGETYKVAKRHRLRGVGVVDLVQELRKLWWRRRRRRPKRRKFCSEILKIIMSRSELLSSRV